MLLFLRGCLLFLNFCIQFTSVSSCFFHPFNSFPTKTTMVTNACLLFSYHFLTLPQLTDKQKWSPDILHWGIGVSQECAKGDFSLLTSSDFSRLLSLPVFTNLNFVFCSSWNSLKLISLPRLKTGPIPQCTCTRVPWISFYFPLQSYKHSV